MTWRGVNLGFIILVSKSLPTDLKGDTIFSFQEYLLCILLWKDDQRLLLRNYMKLQEKMHGELPPTWIRLLKNRNSIEGGTEQAKLTPSWKRRKLHLEKEGNSILHFQWALDYVPGSPGNNIPMAELISLTDKHQIPYQDFPLPKRM